MMSNAKRLHPTAVIFFLIDWFKSSFIGLLPIAVLILRDGVTKILVIALIALSIILIISSILQWYRFTYIVVGDEIRIEKGLIIRKKRYISKNRIQSIDLTQGIVHRLFGLTKVQIETAGNDKKVDASLSSVRLNEGQNIRQYLNSNAQTVKEEQNFNQIYPSRTITQKQLIIAGSTSGSLGVILGLFGFAFSQVESFIPESLYDQLWTWIFTAAIELIILIVLGIAVILWALGILGTVIKYGNFTITRYEEELFITRGLLEKKQITIPLKRIQAIGIKESIMRQPFGLATVHVEIAGGDIEQGGNTLLFPLLKKRDVQAFLDEVLPEYAQVPKTFTKVPNRSLPYYLIRSLFWPLLLLIVISIFWPEWYLIPAVICGIAAMLGLANYQTAGFNLNEKSKQLSVVFRRIGKETVLMKYRRIQSVQKKEHFLQRKQNLASLQVSILNNVGGRHFIMYDYEVDEVHRITDWYSARM